MDFGGDMCRTCMSEDDVVLHNIFHDDCVEESTVSKIWSCLSIKVFLGDGLPSFICHRCLCQLNRLNSFRKMCHMSNIHLSEKHRSSFVQNTTHLEDMELETIPTNVVSPVPFGIGCIVEGSERTLDSEPEFDENEVDDETYEGDIDDSLSRTSSRASVYLSSDESEGELQVLQTQSTSNSMILPQHSYRQSQSKEPLYSNQSATSQIRSILKVHSGMALLPGNDALSNKSSSVSAILPSDQSSNTNFLSAEPTTSNRSVVALAFHTDSCSPIGTLASNTIDVPRINETFTTWASRKLHMEGKYVKEPPKLISKLSQEPENGTGYISMNSFKHVKTTRSIKSETRKIFKGKTIESVGNKSDENHKLYAAPLNTKRQKCSVLTSSIPETPEHSSIQTPRNTWKLTCEKCRDTFNSIERWEIHMQTHCNKKKPFNCSLCDKKFSRSWQRTRHENVHSNLNKFKCERCGKKFTSARYLDRHMNCRKKKHICDICCKAFDSIFYLERHKSRFHPTKYPSSNPKVSSLKLEANSDLQDSSLGDVERFINLCGENESGTIYPSGNERTRNVKLLENLNLNTSQSVPAAGKAEIVSGRSKSLINFIPDNDSRTTVEACGHNKISSSKKFINRVDAREDNGELTEGLGTFKRVGVNISHSSSNRVDGNKFKPYRKLQESTKQLLTFNKSIKDIKLQVNINSGVKEVRNDKGNLNEQVNTVNKIVYACNECYLDFENIDDLMNHEQTVHSKVKIYSCIGCLKMFTYPIYLNDHKKCCVGTL